MPEAREDLCFVLKRPVAFGTAKQHLLDGNSVLKQMVHGFIHGAHATLTNEPDQTIPPMKERSRR
jgi:hypothetical protein